MSGRSPAGPLIREHRVIERMLAVMERSLASIANDRSIDPGFVDQVTDFIRTYADRCHHGKEEDILFRRLADKPLDPQLAESMRELIKDHVYARGVTRRLIDANRRYADCDQAALAEIEEAIRKLVDFYPVHIAKEDRRFFRPCMEYFTDEEKARMLADFEEFDRMLIHEKYRLVVESLEQMMP